VSHNPSGSQAKAGRCRRKTTPIDANVVGGFSCQGVNWEKEAKINQDHGGIAFSYGSCPQTALFAGYDVTEKAVERLASTQWNISRASSKSIRPFSPNPKPLFTIPS